MIFRRSLLCSLSLVTLSLMSTAMPHGLAQATDGAPDRWSAQKANDWYKQQPWLVGANFIPSNAINQLEMFQAATFDPAINDKELGMAESIGMNTVRVFLQDQLWQQDSQGFKQRLDTFLGIAARHHIKPLLVLFDSCWEADPKLGPQHPPIPGIHNSGWVQSPGKARLHDPAVEPQLQAYVTGIVGAFANDDRILGWDIWNEPDNRGGDRIEDVAAKVQRVDELLPKAFAWARSVHPTQPLTSGVWTNGNWSEAALESETTKIQLSESDVITFHNYSLARGFRSACQDSSSPGAAAHLHGVYGARRRLNLRRRSSRGQAVPCRRYQLGSGRRKNTNLSALGFLGAALCSIAANHMVSRSLQAG
jgi:hypothetical protein